MLCAMCKVLCSFNVRILGLDVLVTMNARTKVLGK